MEREKETEKERYRDISTKKIKKNIEKYKAKY